MRDNTREGGPGCRGVCHRAGHFGPDPLAHPGYACRSLLENCSILTRLTVANDSTLVCQRGKQQGGDMVVAKDNKHKDYSRYAAHCLGLAPPLSDEETDSINREMAAEWVKLAELARPIRRSRS